MPDPTERGGRRTGPNFQMENRPARDGFQATATETGRACWRLSARVSVHRPISYSVSGSAPGLGLVMLIASYSVTRTTPGTDSSITSIIVSSTTGAFRPGAFLDAVFAVVFHGLFGVACLAAFLRPALALAFLRFETLVRADLVLAFRRFVAFLGVAIRFFALAMTVSCEG
jgi:hypothetical protein